MKRADLYVLRILLLITILFSANLCQAEIIPDFTPEELAEHLLTQSEVQGGLIVLVGCDEGRLPAALKASDAFLVQAFEEDQANVDAAREHLREAGLYGPIAVDRFDGTKLPLVDNLANLVVLPTEYFPEGVYAEANRVAAPGGVVMYLTPDGFARVVKPRPDEIDDWSHYLHDPSNNAVANDTVIAPPRQTQWIGSPRYSRHHDNMSSFSAAVTSGGRFFYIFDEAPPASIEAPSDWKLIARDAFNGVILWKRDVETWHTRFWPLKSGPAQLPRRLVSAEDRIFATLEYDGPVTSLDAASGETIRVYEGTRTTEEILHEDGTLFLLVDPNQSNPGGWETDQDTAALIRRQANSVEWSEHPRTIKALNADSGDELWSHTTRIMPLSLTLDANRVYFHDGERLVALDRSTGKKLWQSAQLSRRAFLRSFFAPTVVAQDGVILFSGGSVESNAKTTGGGKNPIFAIDAETGETLWQAAHPASGYKSPEDVFVIDGLVWFGATIGGGETGAFFGYDLHSGELLHEFTPDVDTYWFHHRCYRGKATENYFLTSRTGIEFIDPETEHWDINHWVRGACLYGILPANGLIYAPQHPCACYLETKQYGLNALAPASDYVVPTNVPESERLELGPAYNLPLEVDASDAGWPTYRHDVARSGSTSEELTAELVDAWSTELGGPLTAPVISNGRVFVAQKEAHTVWALDSENGEPLWSYTVGGRVDSPPTIRQGTVLFGSADGYVYCLRANTGELRWRFLAAPDDRRAPYFEQLESLWPVHGSLLLKDDVLYCVAGRSTFLDSGMRFLALNPTTGRLITERILDETNPETGENLQDTVDWLNMAVGMPDILSSDGTNIYMRSQPLDETGQRLRTTFDDLTQSEGVDAHLFSPTGFLDDTYWHRSYWTYSRGYFSGWSGYFLTGQRNPSGRLLTFDEDKVYGFGREPKFYRWTTPIEYRLFSADKEPEISLQTPRKQNSGSQFQGRSQTPDATEFDTDWSERIGLYVRAMVLTGDSPETKRIVVAGPPDMVDEEEAAMSIGTSQTQEDLYRLRDSIEGRLGAELCIVDAASGEMLGRYDIDAPPVWDGMAVANESLFIVTTDGRVTKMSAPE